MGGMSEHGGVNLESILTSLPDPWHPVTVAVINDYDVRVAKASGEFTWHAHSETDEFFLVLSGSLTIRMDSADVRLGVGDCFVVPKGMRHQPVAAEGTTILLFEPSDTVNTGDNPGPFTTTRTVVDG